VIFLLLSGVTLACLACWVDGHRAGLADAQLELDELAAKVRSNRESISALSDALLRTGAAGRA
jgi:hypothetical protein